MTRHLTEDEFVLLYYGDADRDERRELERHIVACEQCRGELERTGAFLTSVRLPAPEPSEHYGSEVWRRLAPMLPEKRRARWPGQSGWSGWLRWPQWATAAAMAALAFVAFSSGRWFERSMDVRGPNPQQQSASGDSLQTAARERVLLIAVGAHLEHAQMLLTELANAKPSGRIDISAEQERIQVLLPDNRLYRQTAVQLGDAQIANLLDELERVLLDLSHRPSMISPGELGDIRQQIGPEGLLFKVRIAGSELRGRQNNVSGRSHSPAGSGL